MVVKQYRHHVSLEFNAQTWEMTKLDVVSAQEDTLEMEGHADQASHAERGLASKVSSALTPLMDSSVVLAHLTTLEMVNGVRGDEFVKLPHLVMRVRIIFRCLLNRRLSHL